MAEVFPTTAEFEAKNGSTEYGHNYAEFGADPHHHEWIKQIWQLLHKAVNDLHVYKDGDLTFGVLAGKFMSGNTLVSYPGASAQALTDDSDNYIYITAAGVLAVATDAFPAAGTTPHIPLAKITCADGGYDPDPANGDVVHYKGAMMLNILSAMTAANSNTLVGGSNADALHVHATAGITDASITFAKLVAVVGARLSDNLRIYKDGDLTFACSGGYWRNGSTFTQLAASTTNALTDATTNYIYIDSAGVLQINTTGFPASPTSHVRLATITPAAGTYTDADIVPYWLFGGIDMISIMTAANAATLVDGSNADALHVHAAAGITDGSVSAAKLAAAVQDMLPTLTLTPADDADGSGSVSIQVKDAAGNNLAANHKIRVWTSATAGGAKAAVATLTVPATGILFHEFTANQYIEVITDAAGLVVVDLAVGGASTDYVCAELDGVIYSVQLAITAP